MSMPIWLAIPLGSVSIITILAWLIVGLRAWYRRATFPVNLSDFKKRIAQLIRAGNVPGIVATMRRYLSQGRALEDVSRLSMTHLTLPRETNLSFLTLANWDFGHLDALSVRLDRATLLRVTLSNAEIRDGSAQFLVASGASFNASNLLRVNFNGAILDGADFAFTQLSGADFSNASMIGARLSSVRGAEGTKFHGTNLERAVLDCAKGGNADFLRANLSSASLVNGAFVRASFAWAKLVGADVRGCDLSEADFSRADLSGLIFDRGTVVNGLILTGAKNVPAALLERVQRALAASVHIAAPAAGDPGQTPPADASGGSEEPSSSGDSSAHPESEPTDSLAMEP